MEHAIVRAAGNAREGTFALRSNPTVFHDLLI
jgi:hypothetical protein